MVTVSATELNPTDLHFLMQDLAFDLNFCIGTVECGN